MPNGARWLPANNEGIVRLVTSLKAKLIVAVILILVAGIGVSMWRTLQLQRNQLIAATDERVAMVTDLLEQFIVHEMLEERPQDIEPLLVTLSQYADIDRVRVFDTGGRIGFSSHSVESGKTIPPSDFERYASYLKVGTNAPAVFRHAAAGRIIHSLVKPIFNRPACHRCHDPGREVNGILQIDFSLDRTRAQIASIQTFVFVSALLTIAALSLALWMLLSHLVTRPVSALMDTMSKAKGGDLDARVQVKSKDELGRLGESFNYMIGSLEEAKQELEAEHHRQLEQAEKMASLGQLASAVAHEIKNPLAGVSGAMQVLAQDYPIGDPKREVIEEMLHQIRRLDQTVKDLLSYARPASPQPIPCNASDVVDRALFFVRQQLKESDVSIVTDYGEDIPQIRVDPQQVQQVILNIALNALQAMPGGGTLTVRTRVINRQPAAGGKGPAAASDGACVQVTISDTGRGMRPEELTKVFQPFFTTKHRGTGLGLAICQRIVEEHGGGIDLESEVGKGTTVNVRFPVNRSDA